jgi:uncharacterized protein YyaL (SSP411 family)
MAHGRIFDQLGGGFCRYSVDDDWMIPHFENALRQRAAAGAVHKRGRTGDGNAAHLPRHADR